MVVEHPTIVRALGACGIATGFWIAPATRL
jgi:hypothetical protein